MNKFLLGIAACIAAPFANAPHPHAQAGGPANTPTPAQQITRAGTQAPTAGPAEYFTGRARVDPLFPATTHHPASGAYVTFEPGARSAWHTHPAGQRLVVVSGMGRTQEWRQPAQVIRPGDVWCPPGVKHWHGAAPDTAMTHLAVTGTVDGRSVTWMEKVTDEHTTVEPPACPTLSPPGSKPFR